MRKQFIAICTVALCTSSFAQLSPAITSWLQNTTAKGTFYSSGNSNVQQMTGANDFVNCQKIEYSSDFVYVHTRGIPAYPTGPFDGDGNPSVTEDQDAIYKFPLNPTQNTGTPQATVMGNIGVFINGVALYDYRDGVAWDNSSSSLCGGPGNPPCPGGPMATMDWNRDAIPAEKPGFDCSKGHPAMGAYHHHQNPSAFKLDLEVVSTICNLYDADGLYAIDSTKHAPLLGFAYDGFPIYGAYAYKNTDGTGGIARMKSSYHLNANATTRTNGPDVNATYFNGYFREDYSYTENTASDYLDEHNGRFCVTPEYPNGTYAYFMTVDENWNSAYPYAVGPTFYGVFENRLVTSVSESTTTYEDASAGISQLDQSQVTIFPNPASNLIAIQVKGLVQHSIELTLFDVTGKKVMSQQIKAGQTISYFDTQTLYEGTYLLELSDGKTVKTERIVIQR
ncbi:MAG: YHYH protein [Bacteroidetes bacterium]|nr:MAG: YHYH protein [Bacteroidota bacterium]